jgi:hypothetical protein
MHCCNAIADHLTDGTALVHVPKFREYGIRVLDGGSSFIILEFCPWCGTRLPESLRDRGFESVEVPDS